MKHSSENKVDGIVLVTEDSQEYLNPKQEVTYREHRRSHLPKILKQSISLVKRCY